MRKSWNLKSCGEIASSFGECERARRWKDERGICRRIENERGTGLR